MARSKRVIALLITIVVMAGIVAGVAWGTANRGSTEKPAGLYVDNKRVENPGPIITIGQHDIMLDEYRHYMLLYKYYFENFYGIDFNNDPDGDYAYELQNTVVQELTSMYTLIDLADEMGITLDEADLADINAVLEDQKEQLGSGFEDQLKEMFFTSEENYIDITKKQTLSEKAGAEYSDKISAENKAKFTSEATAEFEKEQISAKHILVNIDTEAEDYEQAKAEALEKAESILEDILAADDIEKAFDDAMHEFSEDGGLAANPDGYTFSEGEMVDIFYTTAKSLEIGEVSKPVLSEAANYAGYHIILRQELSGDELESYIDNYVNRKASEIFNEKIDELRNAATVTHGTYYNETVPANLH